jgi:hypothetical protein
MLELFELACVLALLEVRSDSDSLSFLSSEAAPEDELFSEPALLSPEAVSLRPEAFEAAVVVVEDESEVDDVVVVDVDVAVVADAKEAKEAELLFLLTTKLVPRP